MGFPIFMKGNGEVYERSNSWNCGCSWFSNCILFGGWDAGLTTLLIFMAVDYLSGLIVAGVFTSPTRLTLVHWKARHVGRVFAESA